MDSEQELIWQSKQRSRGLASSILALLLERLSGKLDLIGWHSSRSEKKKKIPCSGCYATIIDAVRSPPSCSLCSSRLSRKIGRELALLTLLVPAGNLSGIHLSINLFENLRASTYPLV